MKDSRPEIRDLFMPPMLPSGFQIDAMLMLINEVCASTQTTYNLPLMSLTLILSLLTYKQMTYLT